MAYPKKLQKPDKQTSSYDAEQRAKGGYSTHVLGPNLPQGQAGFPREYGEEIGSRDRLQSGDRNKAFIKRGT